MAGSTAPIQRSSFAALQNGVSLEWIFGELEMAGDLHTPLVMMSYLNPLLAYGYEKLAVRAGDQVLVGIAASSFFH